MALSNEEIEKLKFYLGYTNLTTIAIGYADIPAIFTTVIQGGLSTWAEGKVREIFTKLDQIDTDIFEARERYQAEKVSSITLNKDEHEQLLKQRNFWIGELESVTGVGRADSLAVGGGGGGFTEVY